MSDMNPGSQVNSSGFPFQLGVENEIREKISEHKWAISATEYKWKEIDKGINGFIDIILENRSNPLSVKCMVIECKRVKIGSWIFLADLESDIESPALMLNSSKTANGSVEPNWTKFEPAPKSYISKYCTVPGQSAKDTPMLEKMCDSLLNSIECIAYELHRNTPNPSGNMKVTRIYIPAIVVNTEIKLCKFNPSDVDLEAGELDVTKAKIEIVPFLRFQKSFATKYRLANAPRITLKDIDKSDQRTVFIINANNINNFLSIWSTD